MKTIDINIATPGVANNVQLISKIGSNLGTQFFKVDVRMAWQGAQEGFERDKRSIESGESKGFILNRSPRRFIARNILIAGTILTKDPINDELGIAINPHEDGTCDLFLPVNDQTLRVMGKTTQDAIAEAIKGEKDHFFLDAKTLTKVLNDANRREIAALEELITKCQKMIVTIKGDISNNDQKAKMVEDAWVNSAVKPDISMPGGNAVVTVTETEG